jgi:serine protease Do
VLLVGLAACEGASARDPRDTLDTRAATTARISAERQTALTRAVARVAPSVVTVQTEMVQRVPVDIYEQLFGGRSGERVNAGIGTGFIITADGWIVTNAHVVAGATRISVAMRDGTTHEAKLRGADEANDLAVLKIEARNLPVAPLGSSDALLIGEWAIAIGNPYGFVLGNSEPSVTAGVISATGRNLLGRAQGGGAYLDMIQTDASINPGNSGGPLVNADGEVIGVNSSIYSPSGGSVGIGFAIPINRAKHVAEDLQKHGSVRRAWLGVKLDLPTGGNPMVGARTGAVVRTVVPGSPAAKAGIRPGDVLVRAGQRVIRNPFDWDAVLLDLRVGERIPIRVRRDSREIDIDVTVADLPEVNAPRVAVLKELELVTVTPAIRVDRGIRSNSGALVYRVSERVSDALGIQTGDVVVQINRTAISDADAAARALDYYGGRGPIRMYFERGGRIYATDFQIQ